MAQFLNELSQSEYRELAVTMTQNAPRSGAARFATIPPPFALQRPDGNHTHAAQQALVGPIAHPSTAAHLGLPPTQSQPAHDLAAASAGGTQPRQDDIDDLRVIVRDGVITVEEGAADEACLGMIAVEEEAAEACLLGASKGSSGGLDQTMVPQPAAAAGPIRSPGEFDGVPLAGDAVLPPGPAEVLPHWQHTPSAGSPSITTSAGGEAPQPGVPAPAPFYPPARQEWQHTPTSIRHAAVRTTSVGEPSVVQGRLGVQGRPAAATLTTIAVVRPPTAEAQPGSPSVTGGVRCHSESPQCVFLRRPIHLDDSAMAGAEDDDEDDDDDDLAVQQRLTAGCEGPVHFGCPSMGPALAQLRGTAALAPAANGRPPKPRAISAAPDAAGPSSLPPELCFLMQKNRAEVQELSQRMSKAAAQVAEKNAILLQLERELSSRRPCVAAAQAVMAEEDSKCTLLAVKKTALRAECDSAVSKVGRARSSLEDVRRELGLLKMQEEGNASQIGVMQEGSFSHQEEVARLDRQLLQERERERTVHTLKATLQEEQRAHDFCMDVLQRVADRICEFDQKAAETKARLGELGHRVERLRQLHRDLDEDEQQTTDPALVELQERLAQRQLVGAEANNAG